MTDLTCNIRPVWCHSMAPLVAATLALSPADAFGQWPQWGGPDRSFHVDSKPLAERWPGTGPKQLWKRELGDGYASIAADAARLYTMYRTDKTEFSVALDARTGKTLWQVEQHSPFTDTMAEWGPGPHVTPLIVGDLVYTIGTNGVMHAIHKDSGKIAWKHDLPDKNLYLRDRKHIMAFDLARHEEE